VSVVYAFFAIVLQRAGLADEIRRCPGFHLSQDVTAAVIHAMRSFDLPIDRREQHTVFRGGIDTIEQRLFAERLDEIAGHPGAHGARANGFIGVGRDQDRRNGGADGNQMAIKRQPAHIWHLHAAIKQEVMRMRLDFRNASADANPLAINPCERKSPMVASRTESSSSTTAIDGLIDMAAASNRLACAAQQRAAL